jgi:hypothetical protein
MSADHPASSIGDFALFLGTSTAGAFALTMALGFPKTCMSESTRGLTTTAPDSPVGTTAATSPAIKCENILGSDALWLSDDTATLMAFLIGGGVFLVGMLIASIASNR